MTLPRTPIPNPIAPLSRLLDSTLTVADIVSSPLWIVPAAMSVNDALRAMETQNFDVGGIALDPSKYVSRQELVQLAENSGGGDPAERYAVNIPASKCIEKSLPITTLLEAFEKDSRLFVLDGNSVRWIVTHADLVAPAVGVAVLAHLSVMESGLKLLGSDLSDEQLKEKLSEQRRVRAEETFEGLEKENKETTFRDGLYFTDWLTVAAKTDEIRDAIGYESRSSLDRVTGSFADLRNDLAHGRSLFVDPSIKVDEILSRIRKIREFSAEVWRAVERRKPIWDLYASTEISTLEPQLLCLKGPSATTDWPFSDPVFILTAWNPGSVWASAEKNKAANQKLKESLTERGASAQLAVGRSPDGKWREESFLVEGLQARAIAELAQLFGQLAFFELDRSFLSVRESGTAEVVRKVDRIASANE